MHRHDQRPLPYRKPMKSDTSTERIVLETTRGISKLGNPNDRHEAFETEIVEVDGEKRRRLELPADRASAAEAILYKHDQFEVVEDAGLGLDSVKSKTEERTAFNRRLAEKHAKQRAEKARSDFDPATSRRKNAPMIHIGRAYDALVDAGEESVAEELRADRPVKDRQHHATKLAKEHLGTHPIDL